MHVSPQDGAIDSLAGVQQVMMVVPIYGHVDETQDVAEEHRSERGQGRPVGTVRHLELKHHDRNDDSNDAIAESRKSFCWHVVLSLRGRIKADDHKSNAVSS